jgi:hypothetical protein
MRDSQENREEREEERTPSETFFSVLSISAARRETSLATSK